MSAFGALADCEGDHSEIVESKRKAKEQKEELRQKEAAAAKVKFEELKLKAGMANWADSDDEDMFKSPPVSYATLETILLPFDRQLL